MERSGLALFPGALSFFSVLSHSWIPPLPPYFVNLHFFSSVSDFRHVFMFFEVPSLLETDKHENIIERIAPPAH
jgi:hypothetical protein